MLACCRPQYSAQRPRNVPSCVACSQVSLTRPATRSVLGMSFGTQKLWLTSAVVSRTCTTCPVGTWISFAVTTSLPPPPLG